VDSLAESEWLYGAGINQLCGSFQEASPKQEAQSRELSITTCFELFGFLLGHGENFHSNFIIYPTSLFIQCLVMCRHKNLRAVSFCSILKGESNGKILNNINVILVMLSEKGYFFLLV